MHEDDDGPEYCPTSQEAQEVEEAAENVELAQGVHAELSVAVPASVRYFPSAQPEQNKAKSPEYSPVPHERHAESVVDPLDGLYLPGAQEEQKELVPPNVGLYPPSQL